MQNFQKSCKLIIVNILCVLPDVFEMFILQGLLCSAGLSVEMSRPNYHNQQVYNSLPRIQVILKRLVSIILKLNCHRFLFQGPGFPELIHRVPGFFKGTVSLF